MSSSTFVGLLFIKLLIGIELLSDNVVVIQNKKIMDAINSI